MKIYPLIFILFLALLLQACGTTSNIYTVKKGDTLSSIAKRHNIPTNELARMNNIRNHNQILMGQKLHIKGPAIRDSHKSTLKTQVATKSKSSSTPTVVANVKKTNVIPQKASGQPPYNHSDRTKVANWVKPTEGQIVQSYNPNTPGQKGIQIAGQFNQAISAANSGEIVFAGQGNTGYGQLIIIKHDPATYSAYGFLASTQVTEGDRVNKGQKIATMGRSHDGRSLLHFEIRSNGKTLNPANYL